MWLPAQRDEPRSCQRLPAVADYTEAIRLDPKYAFAYNNRGLAYRAKGDLDLSSNGMPPTRNSRHSAPCREVST
jgi:tetratricopeptide (TPR) repeat protein